MIHTLIIFLKHPEKGQVKTRLAASIGAERATQVYKHLAEETVNAVRPIAGVSADVIIAYAPLERAAEIQKWIDGPFEFTPQGEGDLGARLSRTVEDAFEKGADKIVVIGTDAVGLDAPVVEGAFEALSRHDVVIGPSEDGGYYLIGMSRARHVSLFRDIPWSTPAVLAATLEKIKRLGISLSLLAEKFDVDTIDDLRRYEKLKAGIAVCGRKISVIIPALNEAATLESLLMDLKRRHAPDEIIVADGGSGDGTPEIAARHATVVRAPSGRASQMNAGAASASGDIFVFLHADTRLPDGAMAKIRLALDKAGARMGRFRVSFGHPHPILKLSEFQTRFHFFSYGDQAFFMTREFFHRLGGFDIQAPFEDIDFYRRASKISRPVILPDRVLTSPRRFLDKGPLRQKMINMTLVAMYYLGCNRDWIRRWHRSWYAT